jgi:hypothetical protein
MILLHFLQLVLHPSTLDLDQLSLITNSLAAVLGAQGKYEQAEEMRGRTLELLKYVLRIEQLLMSVLRSSY